MKGETQQDRILAMWEDGFSPREMQEELGASIGSIYSTHAKFRLTPHKRKTPCSRCEHLRALTNEREEDIYQKP